MAKSERHSRVLALFTADKKEITARDVYRAKITSSELAPALLADMVEAGRLSFVDSPTAKNGYIQRTYQKPK